MKKVRDWLIAVLIMCAVVVLVSTVHVFDTVALGIGVMCVIGIVYSLVVERK